MSKLSNKYTPEEFQAAMDAQEVQNYQNSGGMVPIEEVHLMDGPDNYQTRMEEKEERLKNDPEHKQNLQDYYDKRYCIENADKILWGDSSKGEYGANQGKLFKLLAKEQKSEYDEYVLAECKKIYEKYGLDGVVPFETIVEDLQKYGCGFAALSNQIYETFAENPLLFEEKFGYPMYYKNGEENFNKNISILMFELYLNQNYKTYQNKKRKLKIKDLPFLLPKDDISFVSNNFGIGINCQKISYTEIDEAVKKGKEVVFVDSQYILYDKDGNIYQERNSGLVEDGLHYMTIIGIETINGREMYKVTSWGHELYIDKYDAVLMGDIENAIKNKDGFITEEDIYTDLATMGIDLLFDSRFFIVEQVNPDKLTGEEIKEREEEHNNIELDDPEDYERKEEIQEELDEDGVEYEMTCDTTGDDHDIIVHDY